ncbi:hypothetical protein LLS47_12250 [Rouxiella badensis]|uniref:hypothetical protein n=1 Tax=Rouxiella badensis TaxID=1646377 RepID=UPI001D14562C|nr:hypothetical protein [Rouxiella badensis]MCC3733699.1 hypothetical protein [Rouxiella badensis]MCC3759648.1 hypothetical protein [Rouxiella badensis]
MRPDKFFYPDVFVFNGTEYYGQKSAAKNQAFIAITSEESPFDIGDVITQKVGSKERSIEVVDYEISDSLGAAGSEYPFNITLKIKPLDVKTHAQNTTHLTFNGSVTAGGDIQAGSNNSITKHITIQQLQDAIEKSKDPEVKALWQRLLENPTFSSIATALAQGAIGAVSN